MKEILLLIIFSFVGIFVFAQGVDFQELSLEQALEKAKKLKNPAPDPLLQSYPSKIHQQIALKDDSNDQTNVEYR